MRRTLRGAPGHDKPKICRRCGAVFYRKRYRSGLESSVAFRKRRYCSRVCAFAGLTARFESIRLRDARRQMKAIEHGTAWTPFVTRWKQPATDRHCLSCDAPLLRRRDHWGRLEPIEHYRVRRFCDRACWGSFRARHAQKEVR